MKKTYDQLPSLYKKLDAKLLLDLHLDLPTRFSCCLRLLLPRL
jgi:hypothetical protein